MDTTVILVDEKDNFVGYEKKEICHAGDGKHHRAIALLLFNKNAQILLQRRKHERWDNIWDISGATDVLHIDGRDETYEESGERCMQDELGITANLTRLFGFNYFERYGDMCENEYCMILAGEVPDNAEYSSEVAYGQKWIFLKELAEDMEKHPHHYTPWAVITIKQLMEHPESDRFL